MKLDPGSLKHFRAGQKILVSAVPAHCDYVRMLDEQQPVCNQTLLALFDELLLDRESFGVRHEPRIQHLEIRH